MTYYGPLEWSHEMRDRQTTEDHDDEDADAE